MKKIYAISLFTFTFSLFTYLCEAQYSVIHFFNGPTGKYPWGSVTISGHKIYGMSTGGDNIFVMDTDGSNFRNLHFFNDTAGSSPYGALTISGGKIYGMTSAGGTYKWGVIFSMDTSGSNYKVLLNFNDTNGGDPQGSLILFGDTLYGMTLRGGLSLWDGCVFSIDTNGSGFKDILDFNGLNGSGPCGTPTLSGGVLYGMTASGGVYNYGCIFSVKTNGSGYKDIVDFNTGKGGGGIGDIVLSGNKFYGMSSNGGTHGYGSVYSVNINGSGLKTLISFNDTTGNYPRGDVAVIGSKLYGTTEYGGPQGPFSEGLIFSIDTDGTSYADLHDFLFTSGENPVGNLTLSGNIFYGMAEDGGGANLGVVFGFNYVAAGINEINGNGGIVKGYPNPSAGKFAIEMKNDKLKVKIIEVTNVLGEKVYSQFVNSNSKFEIDLSSNPNGVYFYRIIAENADLLGIGKVVIEK